MIKRVCAAAVVGLFASAVLGQTLGSSGTGSAGTSTGPGTSGPTGTTQSTITVGGSPTTVIAPAQSGVRNGGGVDGGAGSAGTHPPVHDQLM